MQVVEIVYLSVLATFLLIVTITSLPPIWQRYLEKLRIWSFKQAAPFWLVVILSFVIYSTIGWGDGSEKWIRVIGLVLELLGLLFSAQGLLSLRVSHRLPSYRERIQQWWKKFPRLREPCDLNADIRLDDTTISSDLDISLLQDDANLSMEERLRLLFHNQNKQYAEQKELSKSINVLNEKLAAETKQLRASSEDLKTNLMTTMRELDTNGIGKAIFGLALVAVGLILSTISQELACWLRN